eukprot:m.502961 g.502961  ORF g.502961 m.502961 type:complete len:95 (+) comp69770_c0_seq1:151-435(+)
MVWQGKGARELPLHAPNTEPPVFYKGFFLFLFFFGFDPLMPLFFFSEDPGKIQESAHPRLVTSTSFVLTPQKARSNDHDHGGMLATSVQERLSQ